jgi:hypothetical protein
MYRTYVCADTDSGRDRIITEVGRVMSMEFEGRYEDPYIWSAALALLWMHVI